MKARKSYAFTLLELFITLTIVGIIGTLISTNFSIQTFKANENSSQFISTLRFCHQMSLTHNCDVFLELQQPPLTALIRTDKENGLFKQLALTKKSFEGIDIKFDQTKCDKTTLTFFASGDINLPGKIYIYKKGEEQPIAKIDAPSIKNF